MTSYNIEIENDILQVRFDRDRHFTGDRIVRDAEQRLEELIDSGALTGGTLLKINGSMSLPVCYTIAHKLGHLYNAIAVFDPRLKSYVVVISTNPKYQLGDRIDIDANIELSTNSESSFLIRLIADDTLKVGINNKLTAEGDRIVKDTAAQLNSLIESEKLTGKLLKISGRATVLASFVIASKLAHAYGAIAVFDPKEGDKGIDRYIVAISHSPNYSVGDTLDFKSNSNSQQNTKVVICGPPGVGKTVLRDGLQRAIRRQLIDRGDDFLYVISGCPDGDSPAWYTDTAEKDPGLAYELRKACQAKKFTLELARSIAKEIDAIKNPLLLFDVGGQITPENEVIMSGATHAVILAKTELEISQWQEFCQRLNLPVIAIIESDYHGTEDCTNEKSPVLKASVHRLERGEDTSSRTTIKALAKLIIGLFNSKITNC